MKITATIEYLDAITRASGTYLQFSSFRFRPSRRSGWCLERPRVLTCQAKYRGRRLSDTGAEGMDKKLK